MDRFQNRSRREHNSQISQKITTLCNTGGNLFLFLQFSPFCHLLIMSILFTIIKVKTFHVRTGTLIEVAIVVSFYPLDNERENKHIFLVFLCNIIPLNSTMTIK